MYMSTEQKDFWGELYCLVNLGLFSLISNKKFSLICNISCVVSEMFLLNGLSVNLAANFLFF